MKKILLIILVFLLTGCQAKSHVTTYQPTSTFSETSTYIDPNITETAVFNDLLPTSFELVGSSDIVELYLERDTMAIAVIDTRTNFIWASYDLNRDFNQEIIDGTLSKNIVNQMKSGVLLSTYNVFTPGQRTLLDVDLLNNKLVNIAYEFIDQGFIAHIDFKRIMIKFDVIVYLDNSALVVHIPNESVLEYSETLWAPGNDDVSLNAISVYPFFGAIEQTDHGYIVIPDGTGAIVRTQQDAKYRLGYQAQVYGVDLGYVDPPQLSGIGVETVKPMKRITLPIYGMIHHLNQAGMLAIIESGAHAASYNYVPKGLATNYYQSYFAYTYRTAYKQFQSRINEGQHVLGFQKDINQFDIKQRFIFLNEDANYVGLAKQYRSYLNLANTQTEVGMQTQVEMIGNDVKPGLFGAKDVITSTYDQTKTLITQMQADGITNLNITFRTYDNDVKTHRFDVIRAMGGKKGLNNLMAYLDEQDIDIEFVSDYITSYENNGDVAKRMNLSAMRVLNYQEMYPYSYLVKTSKIMSSVKDDLDRLNYYGIEHMALSQLHLGLYTSKDANRNIIDSLDNKKDILAAISLLDTELSLSIYQPDDYLLPYVTKYYDAPLSSSQSRFIDASIPLLPLVVSGHVTLYGPYMNAIGNETHTLLRMVEYGYNPYYILTTKDNHLLKGTNASDIYISNYANLKERMANYQTVLADGLAISSNHEMTNHRFVLPGVSLVSYGNTHMLLNYNDVSVTYEGKTIQAGGYVIYE
jgi:hypothetical protein